MDQSPVNIGRNIAQARYKRCLLYGAGCSAIAHILVMGTTLKLPEASAMLEQKPEQVLELLVVEPPASPVITTPEPIAPVVSPTAKTIHVPEGITTSQSLPKLSSNSQLSPPVVSPNVPIPASPLANPEMIEPKAPPPTTPENTENISPVSTDSLLVKPNSRVTSNGESNFSAVGDRIRTLLRSNTNTPLPTPHLSPAPAVPAPEQQDAPQRVQCVRCDKPEYPAEARNRGLQGQARIAVDVDRAGNVVSVRIVESSGHPELDRAALEQARRWQFTPSDTGKQGITGRINFHLEGAPPAVPKPVPPAQPSAVPKPLPPEPTVVRSEPSPVPRTITPEPTVVPSEPSVVPESLPPEPVPVPKPITPVEGAP